MVEPHASLQVIVVGFEHAIGDRTSPVPRRRAIIPFMLHHRPWRAHLAEASKFMGLLSYSKRAVKMGPSSSDAAIALPSLAIAIAIAPFHGTALSNAATVQPWVTPLNRADVA